MEHREAVILLGEVERVRRRTRAEIGALWFPLVLFGALSVLSTPLQDAVRGIYWAAATPIGIVMTSLYYRRRELSLGVESQLAPVVLAIGVILVGTGSTGTLGGIFGAEMIAAVGPSLAVAAGLLILARAAHSAPLAALALGMAALAVALVTLGAAPNMAASLLAAAPGGASVLLGLAYRAGGHRPGRPSLG